MEFKLLGAYMFIAHLIGAMIDGHLIKKYQINEMYLYLFIHMTLCVGGLCILS